MADKKSLNLQEGQKVILNGLSRWYVGQGVDGEYLFAYPITDSTLEMVPVRESDILVDNSPELLKARETGAYFLEPNTPAGPAFESRFWSDSPYLQVLQKIPTKDLEILRRARKFLDEGLGEEFCDLALEELAVMRGKEPDHYKRQTPKAGEED